MAKPLISAIYGVQDIGDFLMLTLNRHIWDLTTQFQRMMGSQSDLPINCNWPIYEKRYFPGSYIGHGEPLDQFVLSLNPRRPTIDYIEGYRPFGDFRAKLGSLEVLVGANSAGKSSLFEFLRFSREGMGQDIPPEIIAGAIGQQVFHKPDPRCLSDDPLLVIALAGSASVRPCPYLSTLSKQI